MKYFMFFCLSILFFAYSVNTSAQCTGDITLLTQADVDAFPANYGCSVIHGDLIIGNINGNTSTNISNLDSLYVISAIDSSIYIRNHPLLPNLAGLENLTTIGQNLVVYNNDSLVNLSELANLDSIGNSIVISFNENFVNTIGLENITSLEDKLEMLYNPSLQDLTGLENLQRAKYIYIQDCHALTTLANLQSLTILGEGYGIGVTGGAGLNVGACSSLTTIGIPNLSSLGGLNIAYNINMSSLLDLGNVSTIEGNVFIYTNEQLLSFAGLETITTVRGNLEIFGSYCPDFTGFNGLATIGGSLFIDYNTNLTTLEGLENLTNIGNRLIIRDSDLLVSLNGLQNLTTIGGYLEIGNNPLLDTCCPIVQALDNVGGNINIYNNLPNCNSEQIISDNCSAIFSSKIFLEGCYQGNGQMSTNLANILPLTQPFNTTAYNHQGSESLTNIPANVVDWVLVEARAGSPNIYNSVGTTIVEQKAGLLLDDGTIVRTNGTPGLRFVNLVQGQDYHFAIRHRNHLDVLSATPITAQNNMNYDFTTAAEMALGPYQQKISSDGAAMLYVGDANNDGIISLTDFDLWKSNSAVLNAYGPTDLNIDGAIQTTDYDLWFLNRSKVGIAEFQF